jgi:hypothetical protein
MASGCVQCSDRATGALGTQGTATKSAALASDFFARMQQQLSGDDSEAA